MKQANTVGNIPPIELKKLSQQESNRHKREQDYYMMIIDVSVIGTLTNKRWGKILSKKPEF